MNFKKTSLKKTSLKKTSIKKTRLKKNSLKKTRLKKNSFKKNSLKKNSLKKNSIKKNRLKKNSIKKTRSMRVKGGGSRTWFSWLSPWQRSKAPAHVAPITQAHVVPVAQAHVAAAPVAPAPVAPKVPTAPEQFTTKDLTNIPEPVILLKQLKLDKYVPNFVADNINITKAYFANSNDRELTKISGMNVYNFYDRQIIYDYFSSLKSAITNIPLTLEDHKNALKKARPFDTNFKTTPAGWKTLVYNMSLEHFINNGSKYRIWDPEQTLTKGKIYICINQLNAHLYPTPAQAVGPNSPNKTHLKVLEMPDDINKAIFIYNVTLGRPPILAISFPKIKIRFIQNYIEKLMAPNVKTKNPLEKNLKVIIILRDEDPNTPLVDFVSKKNGPFLDLNKDELPAHIKYKYNLVRNPIVLLDKTHAYLIPENDQKKIMWWFGKYVYTKIKSGCYIKNVYPRQEIIYKINYKIDYATIKITKLQANSFVVPYYKLLEENRDLLKNLIIGAKAGTISGGSLLEGDIIKWKNETYVYMGKMVHAVNNNGKTTPIPAIILDYERDYPIYEIIDNSNKNTYPRLSAYYSSLILPSALPPLQVADWLRKGEEPIILYNNSGPFKQIFDTKPWSLEDYNCQEISIPKTLSVINHIYIILAHIKKCTNLSKIKIRGVVKTLIGLPEKKIIDILLKASHKYDYTTQVSELHNKIQSELHNKIQSELHNKIQSELHNKSVIRCGLKLDSIYGRTIEQKGPEQFWISKPNQLVESAQKYGIDLNTWVMWELHGKAHWTHNYKQLVKNSIFLGNTDLIIYFDKNDKQKVILVPEKLLENNRIWIIENTSPYGFRGGVDDFFELLFLLKTPPEGSPFDNTPSVDRDDMKEKLTAYNNPKESFQDFLLKANTKYIDIICGDNPLKTNLLKYIKGNKNLYAVWISSAVCNFPHPDAPVDAISECDQFDPNTKGLLTSFLNK